MEVIFAYRDDEEAAKEGNDSHNCTSTEQNIESHFYSCGQAGFQDHLLNIQHLCITSTGSCGLTGKGINIKYRSVKTLRIIIEYKLGIECEG